HSLHGHPEEGSQRDRSSAGSRCVQDLHWPRSRGLRGPLQEPRASAHGVVPMKVFVQPTCGVTSTSMFRVAHALKKYKPIGVEVVQSQKEADLVVLHTIGPWQQLPEQEYVVIQYCLETAGAGRWSG